MSTLFPAGRLYQRLMTALDGSATIKLITKAITTTGIPDMSIKQWLISDYITNGNTDYPQYATLESFKQMLDTINIIQINGGTYTLDGTISVAAPAPADGGIFIHGAQNFAALKVTGSILVLYSKPTPQ